MNQPNSPSRDDDADQLYQRFAQEFGPPRGNEPPIYGEAQPIPPNMVQLRLPLRPVFATWVLLAINVVVFVVPALLALLGVQVLGFPINLLIQLLGQKDNAAIYEYGQHYRFLSAMFLHGGWMHIAFNAYALYTLGPETERIYGTGRFLALYFIAGLAGGVASYAFSPAPSVGASGAIFGLIGGLAAFYYASRDVLGLAARQQLGSLLTVVMINLFLGFSVPNIDNFAHLGGLFGGAAVGWLLAPRFAVDEYIMPPIVRRLSLPVAWPGALALLAVLVGLVMVIRPPLQ